MQRLALFLASLCLLASPLLAESTVRMALLGYGTVNWEIETIRHYQLDKAAGIDLQVVKMANLPATRLALLNGGADVAVADWMWVSKQRTEGRNYTFIPYSSSVGGLMVRPDAGITSLKELEGKRVGIAGGALSKGWLLLQAVAPQEGVDIAKIQTSYAAPPLLNQELQAGRLDAVITYWHFSAALEAAGMRRLVELSDLQIDLGMEGTLPMLGYVFMEDWGKANPAAVRGLAQASSAAKELLRTTEEAWEHIRPQMNTKSEAHFQKLREGFLQGIPQPVTVAQERDAAKLFAQLGAIGGKELTGDKNELTAGTFWDVK
jgi:NitT/TauT family transport system substrate-binding protein